MSKVSKKYLDEFIEKEAEKILFEEEGTPEENLEATLNNLEIQEKEYQEKIKAQNTLINAIKDREEKIAEIKKMDVLKTNLKDTQKNIESIKQAQQKMRTEPKDDTEETGISVVATTVTETVVDKYRQAVRAPVVRKRVPMPMTTSQSSGVPPQKIKKKNVIIQFDKGTKRPFQVNFTQRGFLIGDTRLSFELLDKAISKKFKIILKDGFILDDIKMQKILRYKDIL